MDFAIKFSEQYEHAYTRTSRDKATKARASIDLLNIIDLQPAITISRTIIGATTIYYCAGTLYILK